METRVAAGDKVYIVGTRWPLEVAAVSNVGVFASERKNGLIKGQVSFCRWEDLRQAK